MNPLYRSALALAIMTLAGAAHAEGAVTTRATDLLQQPQSDAAKVASLPEQARVDIVRRQGAWSEVKSAAGAGWLRMLNLRLDAAPAGAPAQSSNSALTALGGLLTGGRTANSGTATTGVRGLNEEDLKNAVPNATEMDRAQANAVDRARAEDFARAAQLKAVKLDYLPETAPQGGK